MRRYFEPQQRFSHYNRMPATTAGRGVQSMENYLANVGILRSLGLRHGLRWWNYFGVAAFQVGRAACDACAPHADDTEGAASLRGTPR